MKEKLQSVTNYKVMSYLECAKALEWETKEHENSIDFTCTCGNSKIRYSGYIGTERIECESCGKHMVDLFSPIQTGNATCGIIDYGRYEIETDESGLERYWIAIDDKDVVN